MLSGSLLPIIKTVNTAYEADDQRELEEEQEQARATGRYRPWRRTPRKFAIEVARVELCGSGSSDMTPAMAVASVPVAPAQSLAPEAALLPAEFAPTLLPGHVHVGIGANCPAQLGLPPLSLATHTIASAAIPACDRMDVSFDITLGIAGLASEAAVATADADAVADDGAGAGGDGGAGADDGAGGGGGERGAVSLTKPESVLAPSRADGIEADAKPALENFIGLIIKSDKIDEVKWQILPMILMCNGRC